MAKAVLYDVVRVDNSGGKTPIAHCMYRGEAKDYARNLRSLRTRLDCETHTYRIQVSAI